MKSKELLVCIDSNVFISGIAFNGIPYKVIDHALLGNFMLLTSEAILTEVRNNLTGKLRLSANSVDEVLGKFRKISTVVIPTGNITILDHAPDNLVLETALMGGADILVTGDKKHLLPLGKFHGIIIEPPSRFLQRLE